MRTALCLGDVLVADGGASYTVMLREFASDGDVTAYMIKRHGAENWVTIFPWMLCQYRVICNERDMNHGWGR